MSKESLVFTKYKYQVVFRKVCRSRFESEVDKCVAGIKKEWI